MIPGAERLALKLVIGIGCVLLLTLLIQDRNHWKTKAARHAELLAGERAAHQATVANVRAAVERARIADAANAARVRAEQTAINERIRNDYESRLAAARAAAVRLRRPTEAAGASARGGGAAPVPGLSATSAGADQAAGEDRFPDADRLIATEQAIQLDELIKWVRAQAKVDTQGSD